MIKETFRPGRNLGLRIKLHEKTEAFSQSYVRMLFGTRPDRQRIIIGTGT